MRYITTPCNLLTRLSLNLHMLPDESNQSWAWLDYHTIIHRKEMNKEQQCNKLVCDVHSPPSP